MLVPFFIHSVGYHTCCQNIWAGLTDSHWLWQVVLDDGHLLPRTLATQQTAAVSTKIKRQSRFVALLVPRNISKDKIESLAHQWCFLLVIPNLFEHSWQESPSPHFGSELRKSSSLKSSCLEATWQLKSEIPWELSVPRTAPLLMRDRHKAPFPLV